jgi:type II secretory pathway pseudopilin PulG
MAALLVALAVLAVLLTVAMPVWRHEAQREKEAELVWRGEQYARAIALYRAKNQQTGTVSLPPSIDVLVQGRFLRKKYKDPMTKDGEFMVISAAQTQPGVPGPGQTTPGPSRPPGPNQPPTGARSIQPGAGSQPGLAIGGIQGVRSKSQETSLRTYRGATRYDQWAFTFNNVPRPGGMQPGGAPGGQPGPPGGPNSPRGGPGSGTGPNRGNMPPPFGGSGQSPVTRPPGRGGGRGPGL